MGANFLVKSKSGSLIRKWIFHFSPKIQKRIIDPNDPQRRWILWIISKTGYLDTWSEVFLCYGSEKSEYSHQKVTRNNFSTYGSYLTTLLIFMAIFKQETWIKPGIVLSGLVKSQYNCLVHTDKSRQNCYTTSPARLAIFHFSNRYILFQDSSSLGPSKVVSLS